MLINEFNFQDLKIGDSILLKSGAIRFYKNKITVLRGPNGCGKSSLIYDMANIRSSHVKGLHSHWESAWGKIGLVDQDYEKSLFPWLSVNENISLYSMPQNGYTKLVSDFTNRHNKVKNLSGGMKQRLALLKEFGIGYNNLMLLDEPFSSQHLKFREIIIDVLCEYIENGGTVLLVTHDQLNINKELIHNQQYGVVNSNSEFITYEIK